MIERKTGKRTKNNNISTSSIVTPVRSNPRPPSSRPPRRERRTTSAPDRGSRPSRAPSARAPWAGPSLSTRFWGFRSGARGGCSSDFTTIMSKKGNGSEKNNGKRDDIMGIIRPGGRAPLSTAKGIIFLSMVPIRCEVYHRWRGGGWGGEGMGDGRGHVGREFPREWRGMIFDERDRVLVAWR